MSKLSRTYARQLLKKIRNGMAEEDYIAELVKLNHYSSLEKFVADLEFYAYTIKKITTKTEANELKRELMQGLSDQELDLLYRINNISSVEEALFEIGKVIRKRDTVCAYNRRAREESQRLLPACSGGPIEIFELFENQDKVRAMLKRELDAELEKIDNETYQP